MDRVEVLLVGETREWETVRVRRGRGDRRAEESIDRDRHVPSEQAGMDECARWLKTFITGVPIEFVATKQPFWTVKKRELTSQETVRKEQRK